MAEWCRRDMLILESGVDAKYFATINGLFARDYDGVRPFVNDSMALDLDSMETDVSGNNDCTMDCAIGISKYDGQSHTHERFLLVEFRNKYKSVNNLERSKLCRKVIHSKGMLAPTTVHGEPVFIFEDKIVGQAQNWIRNYSNQYSEMKSWKVMGVTAFNDYVGTEADFPYDPVTKPEIIDSEIRASAPDADKLINTYQKWRNIALQYKLRYNLKEFDVIVATLERVLADIETERICSDQDMVALIQEDLVLFK